MKTNRHSKQFAKFRKEIDALSKKLERMAKNAEKITAAVEEASLYQQPPMLSWEIEPEMRIETYDDHLQDRIIEPFQKLVSFMLGGPEDEKEAVELAKAWRLEFTKSIELIDEWIKTQPPQQP